VAKLNISPQALSDLQDIKEYIELENPDAAHNIVSKILKAMRSLADFPDIGSPLSSIIDVHTEYRFLVSGNYLVFYRHEGDIAYVLRVLYGRRDYMKILFGELSKQK
jgi:addiction module RelE/StbE family toxin